MADVVQVNDVLYAMADSVMETVPKPFNPVLKFQDKKINIKIGGKPPREIFYRKTMTFLTKLPPPVQPKLCTCQYLCDGDPAEIKCHSCSIYTPTNSAFYCRKCFDARHPWYRVAHIYSTIEHDESIEHTMKVAHRISEAIRYEKEGQELLHGLKREKERVEYIADDEKVDNQVREFGRRVVALEEHIEELRRNLRVNAEVGVRRKSLVMNQKMHENWIRRLSVHVDESMISSNETYKSNLEEALLAAQKFLETEAASPPKLVPRTLSLEQIMPLPKNRSSMCGSMTASFSNIPMILIPEDDEPILKECGLISENCPDGQVKENNANEGTIAEKEQTVETFKDKQFDTINSLKEIPLLDDMEIRSRSSVPTNENSILSKIPNLTSQFLDQKPETETVTEPISTEVSHPWADREYTHNEIAAAIRIEAAFRGYLGRRTVCDMMMLRIMRVWSPTYGREYYYDKVTGQSSWVLSKLILRRNIDDMEYVSEDSQYLIWVCKRNLIDRGPRLERINPITVLQNFGRCILARKAIIVRANQRFRRVWDPESGTFYYADITNGNSSWQKSGVYLSIEPPVYVDENKRKEKKAGKQKRNSKPNSRRESHNSQVDGEEHDWRISPRINRLLSSSSSRKL